MASLPFNSNYKVYVDPNNTSNQPQVVGYKSSTTFDSAGFYCPYVPLSVVNGAFTPIPRTIVVEAREPENGWWRGVAVLHVGERELVSKSQLEEIHIWCLDQWGAPQIAQMGGRWMKDRELIFVHDERMLVELKVRWHGVLAE